MSEETVPVAPEELEREHPHHIREDIVYYDTTIEENDVEVLAQTQHAVLDDPDEEGELLGILLAVNNSNIVPQLHCWHSGTDPDTVNDLRIVDMVKYGMGLTPGDAELTAAGRSQDHIGVRDEVFFYIARFKDDDLADYFEDDTRTYVAKFTPKPPYRYTGIAFYVKNTSTDTDAIIKQVIVRRRVRGLNPETVAEHQDEIEQTEDGTIDEGDIHQVPTYPTQPNFDYTYTPPEPEPEEIVEPIPVETEYYDEEF